MAVEYDVPGIVLTESGSAKLMRMIEELEAERDDLKGKVEACEFAAEVMRRMIVQYAPDIGYGAYLPAYNRFAKAIGMEVIDD